MGWQTDDGKHEGWVAAQFAGDRLSFGSTGGGAMVLRYDLATGRRLEEYDPANPTVLDGREAVGWRGICECGWVGPLWHRVATAAEHEPGARRIHDAEHRVEGGDGQPLDARKWGEAPPLVDEQIWMEWHEHVRERGALEDVSAQAAQVRSAQDRLAEAVRAARAAGHSWADIGAAAGMSRQAAHERWARLTETDLDRTPTSPTS